MKILLWFWLLFVPAPEAPSNVALIGPPVQADSPVICIRRLQQPQHFQGGWDQ